MIRILGPAGRGRRRTLFGAFLAISLLAVFVAPNAFAVHDYGVFQLDGNALTSLNSTPPANDDWDRVCHQASPSDCPAGTNTTGATAVSWNKELDRSASIFTGGGSKDPINIDQWAWKDGAGGLPDKDNLQHAFAARYDVTGTGGTTDCPTGTTCDTIYLGSDRLDNSGDAQQGFWFLQNACKLGTVKSGGGTNFECTDPTPGTNPSDDFHRVGDLLVISDFSNGGATATINIYKWNGSGLTFLAGGDNVKCDPTLVGDDFCGIVNPTNGTTAPWTFLDKSGNSTYLNGEFFEAGVNLSSPQINLGGECFASLVSETRSSTSTTATLKDFVLGQFAQCTATLETTPSATSVSPSTPVHDTATVIGNQATKTPSGTVTFFLCSYAVGSTASCDGTTGNVGVNIGTGTLSGSGTTATADSPNVNCTAPGPAVPGCSTTAGTSPLAPGHYCFRAEWPGDVNYQGALAFDGSGECFEVSVIPTQISTVQFYYPNDTATIQTSDSSDLPAGSVTFKLYNSSTNCNANGATGLLYGPDSQSIGGVSGQSSGTKSTSNTTVRIPNDTTTLYWRVEYSTSNPAYAGVKSQCVENTTYSVGSADTDTATITNDKTPHS
ncbi:MAG: hypothetical protein ACJ77A_08850 [Actinomycetota bacterium]